MIAFITGTIRAFGFDYVILETNGIGFRINFMHPEVLRLNEVITIYTYQKVSEDDISLFGFVSNDEYNLFTKLISVKGIGPKTAMTILSQKSIETIILAVENQDVDVLKSVSGVGPKAAKQIILDLNGKLVLNDYYLANSNNDELNEAIDSLKALGYRQNEINRIMKELSAKDLKSSDEYIRLAFKLLGK